MSGYDVIGDVHGHADELEALLTKLGYRERNGAWRHPGRIAVFVGDLIDRGPRQVDTVSIVRSMVDAGTGMAVMGNHEYNAIAWTVPDPRNPGDYLRPHDGKKGPNNRRQHEAFLEQVGEGSVLHGDLVDWFRTLPLFVDLGGLRVAHACWHAASIDLLPAVGGDRVLDDDFLVAAHDKDGVLHRAAETVLKGPEMPVPVAYLDKGGHRRDEARVRWWDHSATTMRSLAEIPSSFTTEDRGPYPELPDTPYPEAEQFRYDGDVPVVFGHYWRRWDELVVQPTAACVDLSVAGGGHLAAYRWDGEPTLDEKNIEMVGFASQH